MKKNINLHHNGNLCVYGLQVINVESMLSETLFIVQVCNVEKSENNLLLYPQNPEFLSSLNSQATSQSIKST